MLLINYNILRYASPPLRAPPGSLQAPPPRASSCSPLGCLPQARPAEVSTSDLPKKSEK